MEEIRAKQGYERYTRAVVACEEGRLIEALGYITKAIFFDSEDVKYIKLRANIYFKMLDIAVSLTYQSMTMTLFDINTYQCTVIVCCS